VGRADDLTTFMCRLPRSSMSLDLHEPQGPVQACNGIALPLPVTTAAAAVTTTTTTITARPNSNNNNKYYRYTLFFCSLFALCALLVCCPNVFNTEKCPYVV
jgi:hypothetical protein